MKFLLLSDILCYTINSSRVIQQRCFNIHLYYQRDSLAYPIEVQLWCGKDYYFNLWSHQYVYKYKSPEIGKKLYQEYTAGVIKTEQDFQKRLEECDNGR